MNKIKLSLRTFIIVSVLFLFSCTEKKQDKLLIFAGSASQPATEEIVSLFEKETGIKTEIIFGSSGQVLSQMKINKQGDIYFPGSSDYMKKAENDSIIFPKTEKKVCYLVSAINVPKGNPKSIKSVKDLLEPGLKIALANPENVCVGSYAIEIIENIFDDEEKEMFRNNLINYTGSCSKTATAISLKSVDAVIGWRVFEYWDNESIETVKLPASEIVRVAYIPIAISKFTKNKELAQQFIDFLISHKGRKIFRKHNYLTSKQEAFDYIGAEKPVGGIYNVPENWFSGQ